MRTNVQPTWNQVQFWRADSKYTAKNGRMNYQFHGVYFCKGTLGSVKNFDKYITVDWQNTNNSYYYTWGPTDFTFPVNHDPVYKYPTLTQARWYTEWYWNGSYQKS